MPLLREWNSIELKRGLVRGQGGGASFKPFLSPNNYPPQGNIYSKFPGFGTILHILNGNKF